jgi:hypothetical protein
MLEAEPLLRARIMHPTVYNIIEGHLLYYNYAGKSLSSYIEFLNASAAAKHEKSTSV